MAMLNNQMVNSMFGETPSTSLAQGTSEADLPTQTSGQLAMFEHMAPFFLRGPQHGETRQQFFGLQPIMEDSMGNGFE
jgi:hypothetical protein